MGEGESIDVQLVCAWPERAHAFRASVPRGTTAGQLLTLSRVLERFPALAASEIPLGVFGRKVDAAYVLADGDRVEILRPLHSDPKETRRRRAAQIRTRR